VQREFALLQYWRGGVRHLLRENRAEGDRTTSGDEDENGDAKIS
jgi:hypothetical protein